MLNGRNLRMENWLWFAGGKVDEINFWKCKKYCKKKFFACGIYERGKINLWEFDEINGSLLRNL